MTLLRRPRTLVPLIGFALLLIMPGVAILGGLLPFEFRFEALLAVSCVCIALCLYTGFSSFELGFREPLVLRHWAGGTAITAALVLSILLESRFVTAAPQQLHWLSFAPFYVLVSSPCQEVVCRSVPKLITDRLQLSGPTYVLYSSAVFSLMHSAYADPMLLLNTFVAGLAWSTAYSMTRNIWPLIISHAAVGTIAFSLGVA